MLSMYLTAAIFAQAPGLGKKKTASKALKKEKFRKEEKEAMSEEAKNVQEEQVAPATTAYHPPADEPEPTEKGPETMAKRAAELKELAKSAKEGQEAALRAEAARLEEEKKKEAEKEKEPELANPDGFSNEGEEKEEEEDSSASSATSSEEEKEPESANPDGPILESVPATEEGDLEAAREKAASDLNEAYLEAVRPTVKSVEDKIGHSASRTIVALSHGTSNSLAEASEIEAATVRELQVLGQVNQETQDILLRAEMDKEITKKQNWVQNRLNELKAEDQEVAKAIEFHGEVEYFAVNAMQALKDAQTSKAAAILDWKGCELDLTSSGIDNLSNLTLTESIFAQMLRQTERGESVLLEIENELAAITTQKQEPAIEVDDEEPSTSSVGGEKRSAEMPPPVTTLKAKKAPVQLEKPAAKKEKPEVKAMPKMPEKEQRHDYEGEKEKKRARYGDYENVEVVDRKEVPKDKLYIQLTQQQWDVMGRDSRLSVLKEQVTDEECFFCQKKGHRALYCPMMLTLSLRLGKHMQQTPHGGQDRKRSLYCASCFYCNRPQYAQKGQPPADQVRFWVV